MSINKKILIYSSGIFLFISLIVIVFTFHYGEYKAGERLAKKLQLYTDYAHTEIKLSKSEKLSHAFEQELKKENVTITILNSMGISKFDFFSPTNAIKDYSSCPEFIDAKKEGEGKDIRISSIDKKKYVFFVKKYDNQYIRASIPFKKVITNTLLPIIFVLSALAAASAGFFFISNKVVNTINNLKTLILKMERKEELGSEYWFLNKEFKEVTTYIVNTYKSLSDTRDALYLEKERLFKHLQISQEGLAIYTIDRKEILANELFIQQINLIADKQISSPDDIFSLAEFSTITSFLNDNQYKKEKQTQILEKQLEVNKNEYTLRIRCIIFQNKSFEISINDVTKQEQQALLKKQLTQNISHELKTPVSSIQGFMETIIDNPDLDKEKQDFFIKRCHAQAVRLSYLLRDISLLNKLDEATETFAKEPIILNEIIEGVLNDVALEIEQKKIKLDVFLKNNMKIEGNYSLLYSIFRNLVDNSLNYAGENISIIINCYRTDTEFYYFSYADTGVGVSESHLNRIFDRFYRVDKGRSRKLGGTGLGLAIVKNAVLFHQGRICAKPHSEGGLEFLFTLKKK